MFRRLWSGLPKDPLFVSDLKALGYTTIHDTLPQKSHLADPLSS